LLLAFASAPPAKAEEARGQPGGPGIHEKLVDAVFVRPVGFVATAAVSGAFFLVAYPVSLVLGDSEWVVDVCIREPIDHYIKRPLGEL
jgi:hypothetical protein